MTTTLRDLIDEHSATCFALQDAGNGAAFGGDLIPWDDDADRTYGDLPMIAESGMAPSGYLYERCSEWVTSGEGSNPYRYRVLF